VPTVRVVAELRPALSLPDPQDAIKSASAHTRIWREDVLRGARSGFRVLHAIESMRTFVDESGSMPSPFESVAVVLRDRITRLRALERAKPRRAPDGWNDATSQVSPQLREIVAFADRGLLRAARLRAG